MRVKLSELEEGMQYVSSSQSGEAEAYVCRATGRVIFRAADGSLDADENVPDDIDDATRYIAIPHKNDLDLGRRLALDFVYQRAPDLYAEMQRVFANRGAFSRFKQILDQQDLLDAWYAFESEAERSALLEWAEAYEIEIDEVGK